MKDSSFGIGPHPLRALFGIKRLSLPLQQLEALLSICIAMQISYHSIATIEDRAYICVPFFGSSRLLSRAKAEGLDIALYESLGLPAQLLRHKKRAGLLIGALLGLFIIIFSSTLLWDVRIDGAYRLDKDEVKAVLAKCGLSTGSFKSSLDIDVIENRVLIYSDDISWISINIRGTVANVEIRELDTAPLPQEEPPASNLVASSGGVIVRMEDIKGNIAVNVGDTVGEGQLLVGGIWGDEEVGFKYSAASGRVYAECEESFRVDIPRKYTRKVYTGNTKSEKTLIFFKNEIKFFRNGGNSPISCDKIYIEEFLTAPDGSDLPIGMRTVRYAEYTYEEALHTDLELSRIAELRMQILLEEALGDAELLRRSAQFELSDEGYTLCVRIKCIKNIAKEIEIDIEP